MKEKIIFTITGNAEEIAKNNVTKRSIMYPYLIWYYIILIYILILIIYSNINNI